MVAHELWFLWVGTGFRSLVDDHRSLYFKIRLYLWILLRIAIPFALRFHRPYSPHALMHDHRWLNFSQGEIQRRRSIRRELRILIIHFLP